MLGRNWLNKLNPDWRLKISFQDLNESIHSLRSESYINSQVFSPETEYQSKLSQSNSNKSLTQSLNTVNVKNQSESLENESKIQKLVSSITNNFKNIFDEKLNHV